MASPQPEGDFRNQTHVIHLSFYIHSLIHFPLSTLVVPKTDAVTYLLFRAHSSIPHPRPLPLLLSTHTRRRSAHFSSQWACANRVHAGWVAFLCMVCDQWCHRRCDEISSSADYRLWPCGAAPHAQLRSHLHPSGPTSTATARPAIEGGSFLQLNCNGIQHCYAELQDFLGRHQVLVACAQKNRLGVNSTLKEFIENATIRRDSPHEGGSGLFNSGILLNDATAEVLALS